MDMLELIKRNTQEIITEEELEAVLKKKSKSVYLGTAITGSPHVAYFVWVLKLADFLRAGFKVKLLLADLHGALDGTPWELLEKDYVLDVLKTATKVSINDCKKAAAEVVKFGDNPKLAGLIYPIMQMLDEEYLSVDI